VPKENARTSSTKSRCATSARRLDLLRLEWKRLAVRDDAIRLFASARAQSKAYASGVLAGTELTRVRYAVVVSLEGISVPDDLVEGDVIYRHINIAVSPKTPAKRRI
jgi:hypothetical protein